MPPRRPTPAPILGTLTLDAATAAKLIEAKSVNIREVLAKRSEIAGMKAEDVEKLARLVEANVAHGACGIGCW